MTAADRISGIWTATQCPQWSPADWEAVLSQARASRLHARLATLFQSRGWLPQVPEGPRHHLQAALVQAARQQRVVRWEVDRIAAALATLPGPVVLLKGAAYVAAALPPADGRLFSDVDVMVPRDALENAEGLLLAAGWAPEPIAAYDALYYRRWMHELPPLKHVWRHTWLDLHHTIAPPTSRIRIDGQVLMQRARPLAPGSRLHVLAPEDMVLHSAVHLLQDGDHPTGLRDLLDMNDLVRHHAADAAFWPALCNRALELGAAVPLHHALRQIQLRWSTPVPAAVQQALQAAACGLLTRRLMPPLLDRALDPPHPDCQRPGSAAARLLLYVRSHWLRMPWYLIVPHLLRKGWMRLGTPPATADGQPAPRA